MTTHNEQMIAFIGAEKMKVSCLITPAEKELLQELFDLTTEQFNTSMVFSDPDGTPVLRYSHFTDLCLKHIRSCEEGLKRCMLEAEQRGKQSDMSHKPMVYKCHAGIFDFTVPIHLFGRRIGNISGGQSFTKPVDDKLRAHFNRYFDEIGVADKEQALQSIERHQVNSPARLERIAAIYFNIGKLLSNYFQFQAEHNYWQESMAQLNAELEQRVSLRTLQLEEKISELKRTQMQLIQQEKLVGIGQLAAGVAHEINNPLGFIISNLNMLDKYVNKFTEALNAYQKLKNVAMTCNCQDVLPQLEAVEKVLSPKKLAMIEEDAAELLTETRDGLTRIVEIVKGLRVFSRVDEIPQNADYDLNASIATTLLIVQNEYRDHARIELQLREIPHILVNGSEMNQVLLSVLMNAVQAIRERYQTANEGVLTVATSADAQHVFCEITDNGCGIPEQLISRIFEPFFTTKPPGQGTGLGLSTAYDVVSKAGGDIRVESKVGVGTKFCIVLPLEVK